MKYIVTILIACFVYAVAAAQNKTGISPVVFHSQKDGYNNSPGQKYMPAEELVWKFKTGDKIFSSPAVSGEMVFTGSGDKNFYAVNIKTGKQAWVFTTGGAVHSSPAIYDNMVYVGSMDGYYYALDIITGKQKWRFKTGGEKPVGDTSYWGMKPAGIYMEDPWDCFLSSPVAGKGSKGITVYFGSSDGNLYAVNAKDGSLKWKFKTNGSIHASPALQNGIIYIGSWDTYLYAVNAESGKELWKFKTGGQMAMTGIQASATVENGVVYFGTRDAHLYALNAGNGDLVWTYDAQNSWIISSAVIKDGVLYAGTSDSYLLLALDIKTGKEKYRFKTNGYVFGTPAIAGSTAYFGDFTGKMYSLDLSSGGKIYGSFSTALRRKNATAVLKNDTLDFVYAAREMDLSLYASTKKVMDGFYSLGSIVSSPAVTGGVIYFGSSDGYLYALHVKDKQP